MTDESLRCASCGGEVSERSVECNECGNHPSFEVRKLGAAVVFGGSLLTQMYLYFGVAAVALGLVVVTTSVFLPLNPAEHDFEFDIV
jgi:hypothetical protein